MKEFNGTMMYFVTTAWRGSLNISNARMFTDLDEALKHYRVLAKMEEPFLSEDGTGCFIRIYESKAGEPIKLMPVKVLRAAMAKIIKNESSSS